MNLIASFPPVIDANATTLVLGSAPGKESLRQQKYYAHPQNLFWSIALSTREHKQVPYAEKLLLLHRKKVALWDVLKQCERPGSLDSSIVSHTEYANNIVDLLQDYPSLNKICFNGQKAFQLFKKHILKQHVTFLADYPITILPSTSPANAAISRDVKSQQWRQAVWEKAS